MHDVVVVGAGLAGLATAMRLQARGLRTLVLEAHSRVGGCAGFYARSGFSFDVGATTLVDFEPGGVGGCFLDEVGLPPLEGDFLPGYQAWLPDRCVKLHRDPGAWATERLATLGNSAGHRAFWSLMDRLGDAFWPAARRGVKMPMRSVGDVLGNARAFRWRDAPLLRALGWSMGEALDRHHLADCRPLVGLLSMMVEDTVHAQLRSAPLVNAALGIGIRGAGLARMAGGMRGFVRMLLQRYVQLGGAVRLSQPVGRVEGRVGDYRVHTLSGQQWAARQVVLAVPAQAAVQLAAPLLEQSLQPYLQRDEPALGGGLVLFMGVPDQEVMGQPFTHHQLLQDYAAPLGNGNNMFISVSAPGDTLSAPAGHRAVMVSTHCELRDWEFLNEADYAAAKRQSAERLLGHARRVYPRLGGSARVMEMATPRSYQRFTLRPRGAVGGARLTLANSNQHAIPYDIGPSGLWLVGDTTWPGLGTVACVLASRHVAEGAASIHRRSSRARCRLAAARGGDLAPQRP
ncbi:phytoene desaturase family protein [Ideonella sp. YS5]|uniref:phytoene desaturase family protein n=1 Tax=Ideonella sp. YS5 TaxID=3453714 RepID=UPI003EEF93AA